MSSLSPTEPRALRADAARNRSRVLEAAHAAFSEHGLEAQMEDVARRAEVGVGTVYRHFPTKKALIEAFMTERYEQVRLFGERCLAEMGPWEAFEAMLRNAAEIQSGDRAFAEVVVATLGERGPPKGKRAELHALMQRIITRGQKAGRIRPDLTADDMPPVFCGLAMVAGQPGVDWKRYLEIVLDGLRARSDR